MGKSKTQKLNYTKNLTETNAKRSFLHFKRTVKSAEKHLQKRKTKDFIYLKFKPKNQSPSEENEKNHSVIHSCIKIKKQYKSST